MSLLVWLKDFPSMKLMNIFTLHATFLPAILVSQALTDVAICCVWNQSIDFLLVFIVMTYVIMPLYFYNIYFDLYTYFLLILGHLHWFMALAMLLWGNLPLLVVSRFLQYRHNWLIP